MKDEMKDGNKISKRLLRKNNILKEFLLEFMKIFVGFLFVGRQQSSPDFMGSLIVQERAK